MLGGDGGIGKSTLAIQIGVAGATSTTCFGLDVAPVNTFVLSAEDDRDEMHYRLEQIVNGLPGDREEHRRALDGKLWLLDATNELDPMLAIYDSRDGIKVTLTFERIEAFIREKNDAALD